MMNEDQIIPYQASELPVDHGPWLVFAPHADDETFGMGGTLIKAASRGIRTNLVIMTDGALGGSADNLVRQRRTEACTAAEKLGMQPPVFLDFPDRGLKPDEDSLAQVKEQITRAAPAAVFFPGVFELHPDHRTAAAIVWQCLQDLKIKGLVPVAYEILVQSPVNTLIDISSHINKKQEVMQVYRSQLGENRYVDVAMALNRLRTLTLPANVAFAEGFHRYAETDLATNLEKLHLGKMKGLFQV